MGRGHISGVTAGKGVISRVRILFPSQYISETGVAKSHVNPADFSAIDFTKETRKAAHFPTWPYSMSWSRTSLAIEIWAVVLARGTRTPSEPLALLPALTVEHICYQEAESQRANGGRKKIRRTEVHIGFFKPHSFSGLLVYMIHSNTFTAQTTQQFCYMRAKEFLTVVCKLHFSL